MTEIIRQCEPYLRGLLKHYPAMVLTGARQTGKTTLLRHMLPDYHYVSLDLPSVAEMAEKAPDVFLREHSAPVLIDEVQYAPGLFRHIKAVIDLDRHSMGRFVLTGSQKFNLMRQVSDSLAGRCVVLDLEGLSWSEIKGAGIQLEGLDDTIRFLARGQMPELWRNPALPASEYHRSYIATYLERDVRQILNVTSLRDFERFMRVLAVRNGQLLNKADVARDAGVSTKAAADWLSVLQASSQIVLMEPFFANFSKRVAKQPKLYFCDTGILCALLGIDEMNMLQSPFIGALWETAVLAEVRKLNRLLPTPWQLWFYRDQTSREIDLILESAGRLRLAEIKWTEMPDLRDCVSMNTIGDAISKSTSVWRCDSKWVIARVGNTYPLGTAQVLSLPQIGSLLAN